MPRFLLSLVVLALSVLSLSVDAPAQGLAQCQAGGTYLDGTGRVMYCTGTGTATQMPWASDGVPSGMILFRISGACPSGWTEVAALNGRDVRGTVAANGNVGQTGGSDTYTPQGTNAAITAGTPTGTNSTSATSGNCAATNIAAGTGSTTACKATAPNLTVSAQTFTGSALGTHTHAFTGTPASVIPAYTLLIACSKN